VPSPPVEHAVDASHRVLGALGRGWVRPGSGAASWVQENND
jgi:hypothetical protein